MIPVRFWRVWWAWWCSMPGPIVIAGRYQSQPSRIAFRRWVDREPERSDCDGSLPAGAPALQLMGPHRYVDTFGPLHTPRGDGRCNLCLRPEGHHIHRRRSWPPL